MQLVEEVQELFNTGDPEVRKWFLVRNNYLPFILCFSYFIISVTGPSLMKNRKPLELRKAMIIFNFSVVATYSAAVIIALYCFPKIPLQQYCMEGQVKRGDPTYLLTSVGWLVYILKYIQFLDTIFFILRKKENLVTFLHVFHHFFVPLIGWVLMRTERNGMQIVPVFCNTVVHIVMYTYYGMAAMGPKMRKHLWWKKYLTQLQIVQFILILLYVAVIAPMSGCSMIISGYMIDVLGGGIFLYLFFKFYQTAFKSKDQERMLNGTAKSS